MPFALIVLVAFFFLFLLALVALVSSRSRRPDHVRRYIESRAGKMLDCRWADSKRGWFRRSTDRICDVRYLDHNGHEHEAACKPGLLTGIRLCDDRIVKSADLPKESAEKQASRCRVITPPRSAWMRLIPYQTFLMEVAEPPSVLAARMGDCTRPDTWFSRLLELSPFLSSLSDRYLFVGKVWDSGFRVQRIISYSNPFRPRLCGRFIAIAEMTRVEIALEFPETRGVLAWMGLVGVFGIFALTHLVLYRTPEWPFVLIPWAMVLFCWVMIEGGFWLDAPTSRREIIRILSGS